MQPARHKLGSVQDRRSDGRVNQCRDEGSGAYGEADAGSFKKLYSSTVKECASNVVGLAGGRDESS